MVLTNATYTYCQKSVKEGLPRAEFDVASFETSQLQQMYINYFKLKLDH